MLPILATPRTLALGLMLISWASCAGAGAVSAPASQLAVPPPQFDVYSPKGSQAIMDARMLDLLSRAGQRLQDGDLLGAEQAYVQAVKIDSKLYSPRLGLADVALRSGKFADAERHLREALVLAPNSAELAAAAGRLAWGLNRLGEAKKQFERAILLDPEFVTPMTDLGELHLFAGRPADAAKAFRSAVAVAPQRAGAHFGLARALAAQRDIRGASAELEAAARLSPAIAAPLVALGELQAQAGQFDKARESMSRALTVEPANSNVRMARANVLAAAGDVNAAAAEYAQVAEVANGNSRVGAEVQFRLGQMLETARRLPEAQAAYAKAVALEPKFHLAHNNFAWVAVQRNQDLDLALQHAKRALELAPGSAGYEDTLGAALFAKGDAVGALNAYQRALKLAPAAPNVLYRLGLLHESVGRKDDAVKAYKAALASARPFVERDDASKHLAALGRSR